MTDAKIKWKNVFVLISQGKSNAILEKNYTQDCKTVSWEFHIVYFSSKL